MNASLREVFRENLVRQLAEAAPLSLRVVQLALGARLGGVACTETEVALELDYLADKGLATRAAKTLSPEVAEWKITAAGRDFAAEHGLA